MEYSPLINQSSTPHGSTISIDTIDNNVKQNVNSPNEYYCRQCKHRLIKKQELNHTPIECLSQRCEFLENEVIHLKDHAIKSKLQVKELENKIIALENAIKGLTTPIQEQATPYSFGLGHKHRKEIRKTQSIESVEKKSEKINYDHILQPRSNSRERVGLFGSLGASSQK